MSETKDWSKICAACHEGEPPKDCEYYGEPGGCNAPTMGKHPTCKESLQVGNAAAMFKALKEIYLVCWKAGITMSYAVACGIIKAKSRAALSDPPRNIDAIHTQDEMINAWNAYVRTRHGMLDGFFVWLFDKVKGESK